jgi:hypothetical protein
MSVVPPEIMPAKMIANAFVMLVAAGLSPLWPSGSCKCRSASSGCVVEN